MIRRLLPILLSLAVLLPSWAAAQDAGVETVVVWTSNRGEGKTALETLVDRFNGSSVDVQIELLAIPSKAYKSRLQAAIPRGNGPDLFIEAHELVGEWSKNRLLVPALPTDTTRFTPSAIDALRLEGHVWWITIVF